MALLKKIRRSSNDLVKLRPKYLLDENWIVSERIPKPKHDTVIATAGFVAGRKKKGKSKGTKQKKKCI